MGTFQALIQAIGENDQQTEMQEKLAAWVDAEGLAPKRPADNEGDAKHVVDPNKSAKFRKLKDRRICIVRTSYR